MTSPAETLTAAAQKLRALAAAASTDNDGIPTANWHTKPCRPEADDGTRYLYGDHLTRDDGRTISWPRLNRGGSGSLQRPSYMHGQHAEYAAAVGPAVGLTLADWLDVMALCANDEGAAFLDEALAVARQLLGGQP